MAVAGGAVRLAAPGAKLFALMSSSLSLRVALPADASAMHEVIQRAFSARPAVDPPAAALGETAADVAVTLREGTGVCAEVAGQLVGCLLISYAGPVATLQRISVLPEYAGQGIAGYLVTAACQLAAEQGATTVELVTRSEFPELTQRWTRKGFEVVRQVPEGAVLARPLPVLVRVATGPDMQRLGARLAQLLRAGDVVILSGELGAGKTTLTQGIGQGLGVDGAIISPTFVISRVHPNPSGRPDLVHVDAYRLGSAGELADIDLDASLDSAVTIIEWGEGKAEWLSPERLDVLIERSADPSDDTRYVYLAGTEKRWRNAGLEQLA